MQVGQVKFALNALIGVLSMLPVSTLAQKNLGDEEIPANIITNACIYAKDNDLRGFHRVLDNAGLVVGENADWPIYSESINSFSCGEFRTQLLHYSLSHKSVAIVEIIIEGLGGSYNLIIPDDSYPTIIDWLSFLSETDPSGTDPYDDLIEKYTALGAKSCAELQHCKSETEN